MSVFASIIVACFAWVILQGNKRDQALAKYSMIESRADSGAFGFRRFGHWRDDPQGDPVEASSRQLARYDVLADPDWRARDDVRSLPERERADLETWLFEQLLRHAVALGQRPDSPGDWQRGLALVERTLARSFSAPLQEVRLVLRASLKLSDPLPIPADTPRLPRWMDDYLAGVAAEPLHAREALGHYRDALQGRPHLFWGHYRAAVVACRIDEYPEAVGHIRHCVERRPENPALHLHLASLLYHVERQTPRTYQVEPFDDAIRECNVAIALDPDFAHAYRIRSLIRKALGRNQGVQADLDRSELMTLQQGQAQYLGLRLALNLHPRQMYGAPSLVAETLARQIVDNDPADSDSRGMLASMLAAGARTSEALSEFDRVLETDPDHLRARFQRAVLLLSSDPASSNREFASLIEHPRFEELFREQPNALRAFHYVATDLMTKGKLAEAAEIAHRSLIHVNRSRSFLDESIIAQSQGLNQYAFSPRGETYYLLARIHAVAAREDRARLEGAIAYLARSFDISEVFRDSWFANDRMFEGLRDSILERMNTAISSP